MKQLSAELEVTEVDTVEAEEDKEWAAVLETQKQRRLQDEVGGVCMCMYV